MNKRYLLIIKYEYSNIESNFCTEFFYTLEEAKIVAKNKNCSGIKTTIIDLENENIKWQGCE